MTFDEQSATHAGGVVYRRRGDVVEYLLVQSSGPMREWVLPKGRIEAGESARDAAVREVLEETRVAAHVVGDLDGIVVSLSERSITVWFYLMEALPGDSRRDVARTATDEARMVIWLPPEQAQAGLAHESHRQLLARAERMRRGR